MPPQEFIHKWKRANLSERSAYHQHFLDLCDLLNQPKPAAEDPDGAFYTFERGVRKTDGSHGWADVWFRGHFGWEYKKKHKDLDAAYNQFQLGRGPAGCFVHSLRQRIDHRLLLRRVEAAYAGHALARHLVEAVDCLVRGLESDPRGVRTP